MMHASHHYREWWEAFRVLDPGFSCADVAFRQGFLPCFECRASGGRRHTLPERSLCQSRVCYDIVVWLCVQRQSSSAFGPVLR